MTPDFKIISDLFNPPSDLTLATHGSIREGKTPEESEVLGSQSLNDGDVAAAIKHFQNALAQKGKLDGKGAINLASAYEYADQFPQAMRQYLKALEADQELVDPHAGLSDLYKRYGRYKDAVEELIKASEKEPANSFWKFKLAETLLEMGEKNRALQYAQQAIAIKPDIGFYHLFVAELLSKLGKYEEALQSYRAAVELEPGDDYYLLRTAVTFWKNKRFKEAIKAVRLASDLAPEKNLYHGLLAQLYAETDQLGEADAEEARAAKMDRYDEDAIDRLLEEMEIV